MSTLKIALLQVGDCGSLGANLKSGLEACASAAANGADIALLPEIWSHGYRFFEANDPQGQMVWRASALAETSDFISEHRRAARELRLAIGCTYLEAKA